MSAGRDRIGIDRPVVVTGAVALALCVAAALRYDGFASWEVALNLAGDQSFLGVAAVGLTFVILAGGIDLSVGAMIALSGVVIARLLAAGAPAGVVLPAAVLGGALFGAGQGGLIAAFRLPAFLVTLGGMFLLRGLAYTVSLESVPIRAALYEAVDDFGFRVFPVTAAGFLGAAAAAAIVLRSTSFGRGVYAVGGSARTARLMGLPVRRIEVGVYAISGACAALAGVLFTFYTGSGNANAATMLELDAIAAVVIGGTRLAGGAGGVGGTVLGVLILGVIRTAIVFEGTLSAWWSRIATGALLLVFIALQRGLERIGRTRADPGRSHPG